MNTSYQPDLHILNDQLGDDLSCSVIKTALSGHMVTSYTSIRTGSYRSVYVRVVSANGVLTAPILVPDVTDNHQKDADLAPIAGTDNFVAVWSSNAVGNAYRVYARCFTVGADGRPSPVGSSLQISQFNGDYVAPRLGYNKLIDKFLVTWISVADKSVQTVYLNNNPGLTPAGYQGSYPNTISPEYYVSSLDVHNSTTLSIALFNTGIKVIAAYKLSASIVDIFQYTYTLGAIPEPIALPTYEVSGFGKFNFAYDEVNSTLKVVFVRSNDYHVFGDTISYFGKNKVKASPVQLNQANQQCYRPYIKRTPLTVDNERNFVVAWETTNYGTYYNTFDSNYSQLSSEQEINPGVSTTDKPRIIVTDNQMAFVVQATRMGSETLSGIGLLYYAANR